MESIVSVLAVLLSASVVVCFSLRDRNYWRGQYQKLAEESREREKQLYDQLLLAKGFRQVSDPLKPVPSKSTSPVLGEEDTEHIADRISERVELGLLTAGEGQQLLGDVRFGKRSQGEIDRILWERQRSGLNGSVGDIE